MMQKVGAAILLAEQEWNQKTAKESKDVVIARAAIEAMREPTEEMYDAGALHDSESGATGNQSSVWLAMIDAALAE